MRRLFTVILLLPMVSALLTPIHASGTTIDLGKPANYLLGICRELEQLDCLEPTVAVLHSDGSISQAKLLSSDVSGPFIENKNLDLAGMHLFRVSSGSANGYERDFRIRVALATPGSNPLGILEVRVIGAGKKLKSNECEEQLSKLCTRYTLDPEDKFRIVIRSQELPVHWMGAGARDGDVVREDYLTGERWILSGAQELMGWNPGLSWAIAAVNSENLSTFFKDIPRCSKYGVLFLSSNGVTGGLPSWNKKTNSLNFGVFGPHFDANGDLYRGFFKARIPKKWLDCTYPENTLSAASQVVVNITYDDGSVQVTTTHTKITDEIIYIDVPVFHFSSPTIQVMNADKAASTPRPSPKVRYCSKGKVKKPLSGSTCPKGWKLVA